MTPGDRPARRGRSSPRARGFTLIEIMVTVAIVAILAAIALPMYRTYMVRGKLVAGTQGLASLRLQMEQYYQDNRTYQNTTAANGTQIPSPCQFTQPGSNVADTFTLSCSNLSDKTYLLTATGSGLTNNAIYTVDQANSMATLKLPAALGALPPKTGCWILRQGDTCAN